MFICVWSLKLTRLSKVSKQILSSYILQRESGIEMRHFSVFQWVPCKYPLYVRVRCVFENVIIVHCYVYLNVCAFMHAHGRIVHMKQNKKCVCSLQDITPDVDHFFSFAPTENISSSNEISFISLFLFSDVGNGAKNRRACSSGKKKSVCCWLTCSKTVGWLVVQPQRCHDRSDVYPWSSAAPPHAQTHSFSYLGPLRRPREE